MKTDNVYIAELGISKKVTYNGSLIDYFTDLGIQKEVSYTKLKYILIKTKRNFSFDLVGKDLNSNKKYLCDLPFEKGRLFIPPSKLIPFDAFYPDAPRNLSKRKILKMGNYAIQELINEENKINKEEE